MPFRYPHCHTDIIPIALLIEFSNTLNNLLHIFLSRTFICLYIIILLFYIYILFDFLFYLFTCRCAPSRRLPAPPIPPSRRRILCPALYRPSPTRWAHILRVPLTAAAATTPLRMGSLCPTIARPNINPHSNSCTPKISTPSQIEHPILMYSSWWFRFFCGGTLFLGTD